MYQTNKDDLQSCSGISFKSQALYFIVYVTRYLDLLWVSPMNPHFSLYNTIFKILFIGSSAYTIYLMTTSTHLRP